MITNKHMWIGLKQFPEITVKKKAIYWSCHNKNILDFTRRTGGNAGHNILSRASSTSTSVTFRLPSLESFSVMMSEGTSSLTFSPSSSDLASQRSQGKMTVSEPLKQKEKHINLMNQSWRLQIRREQEGEENVFATGFWSGLRI